MPETRVINVRLGEGYDLYIGRANARYRLKASKWANPFKVDAATTVEQAIEQYRDWIADQPELLAQIGELYGKRLGCWCAPPGGVTEDDESYVCHGQVLAELAGLWVAAPGEWDQLVAEMQARP